MSQHDRPWQLARAWQTEGHSATVFIADNHHLLEKGRKPEPDFMLDGVRYLTVPARAYFGNGLARLLNMWDFTKNFAAIADRVGFDLPKPDAIVASSPHPFTIFPAHRLARRFGARLVFEVRDIWPLSITEILGTSPFHPFVQLCSFAERFALKQSDLIASPLPRFDRYLSERGYKDKPFVWAPNGVGISRLMCTSDLVSEEAKAARAQIDAWRIEDRIVVIHAGAVGKPNAVDLLLKAVVHGSSLGEDRKIGLLIVGRGEELKVLREFAGQHQMSNVYFSGMVPKFDAEILVSCADIGYAGVRNIEALYNYGIALNKIASYLAASLPVLLPIAPCGDPVSESGAGIAQKAETPEAVWAALQKLVSLSAEERRSLGERGKAYIAKEYDYGRIAAKYATAISAI